MSTRRTVLALVVAVSSWALGSDLAAQPPLPLGDEFQVNVYTAGGQGIAVAARDGDGDLVVVWSTVRAAGDFDVVGRRVDASGTFQ